MPIIRDEWESYRREVIPAGAPAIQLQESKRAFYAGAQALYRALLTLMDPSSDEPTEQDMLVMSSVARELREFCASVTAGRN